MIKSQGTKSRSNLRITLHANRDGKFQGTITPTTPKG
ncbi:Uncharacterised protein [Vibrio cholerae]|nr:Uncharacterised protein [Vibrio cholerae]